MKECTLCNKKFDVNGDYLLHLIENHIMPVMAQIAINQGMTPEKKKRFGFF